MKSRNACGRRSRRCTRATSRRWAASVGFRSMVDAVLTIEDASKRFGGTRALHGAGLELRRGEWLALLGPNGAGKTTLVRAVAGRVRLDAGRLALLGRDLDASDATARARLGIVPQEIALYPFLTATENLRAWGTLHRRPGGRSRRPRPVGAQVDRARRARRRTRQAVLRRHETPAEHRMRRAPSPRRRPARRADRWRRSAEPSAHLGDARGAPSAAARRSSSRRTSSTRRSRCATAS